MDEDKPVTELTTEELARKLFPPEAIERVRKIVGTDEKEGSHTPTLPE